MEVAKKVADGMECENLITQGNGSGMEEMGAEETVRCIVDGVWEIKDGKKGV